MTILAIDTTSEAGGVAFFDDEACTARVVHDGAANEYSISLFEMVERLLAEVSSRPDPAVTSLADIDLYVVANGPGSFTGIRVGLSAAQAWAKVFSKPVRGVSVLQALAEAAQPESERTLALINAYRGEFYVGQFRKNDNELFVASGEDKVLNPEELKSFAAGLAAKGLDCTCIVRAHDKPAHLLREILPGGLRWQIVEGTLLEAIARLGRRAALDGKFDSPGQLDAYYIRRTDAELNWKE